MLNSRFFIVIKRIVILLLIAILILLGFHAPIAQAEPTLPYLELVRPDRGRVFAVTWSPDGKYIAVGTESGLWIYTDTLADVLHVADEPIHALAWSPDGKTIATGYFGTESEPLFSAVETAGFQVIQGGGLRLWSVQENGQKLQLIQRDKLSSDESVYSIRFNPKTSTLATLALHRTLNYETSVAEDILRFYDSRTEQPLNFFTAFPYTVLWPDTKTTQSDPKPQGANSLAWSQDGRYLAVNRSFTKSDAAIETNFGLTIWDENTQTFLPTEATVPIDGTGLGVAWINHDTQVVLTLRLVAQDPTFETPNVMCDFHAPLITNCVTEPLLPRQTVAGQPNGNLLAYDNATQVTLERTSDNAEIATLDVARDAITMLEWSPDGSKLLFSGNDYAVRIWTKLVSYTAPDPNPIKDVIPSTYDDITLQAQPVIQTFGYGINYPNQINVIDPQTHNILYSAVFTFDPRTTTVSPQGEVYVIDPNNVLWSVRTAKPVMQLLQVQAQNQGFYDDNSIIWRPDGQAIAFIYELPDVSPAYVSRYVLAVQAFPSGTILTQTIDSSQWDYNGLGFDPYFGGFGVRNTVLQINRWSADGRLIALNSLQFPGAGYAGGYVLIWDTQTNSFMPAFYGARLSTQGGTGGGISIIDWSPDSQAMATASDDAIYYYRLQWSGNKLISRLVWTRTMDSIRYESPFIGVSSGSGTGTFSPDSRYFFFEGTVYDAVSGWPIFRFRNGFYIRKAYWHGDTLTVYQGGQRIPKFAYDIESGIYSADHILTYRTSDFLPKP